MIVITGATGGLGKRTIAALLEKGVKPDTLVAAGRDSTRLRAFAERGLAVRIADYDAPETLVNAFGDADKVFFVAGRAPAEERIKQHHAVIDAAEKAGVGHLVFNSFLDTNPDSCFPFAIIFAETEKRLRESPMAWTVMRNTQYAENLLAFIPDDADRGEIAIHANTGRVAFVTRDDLAAAAAAILTGVGHEGKIYEITGPEALDYDEVADILGKETGKQMSYRPISIAEYRADMERLGLPDYLIESGIGMHCLTADGVFAKVTDDFERLVGRKPQSLANWLSRR